jgi:predicted metal-dependent HD superfamily phosphohydrolase
MILLDRTRTSAMRAIYHAANPVDAQLAVDRLAAEGIAAHVQGAYLSGGVGELPAGDLLRVWVADEDAVRALAALAGATPQPVADDALDPRLERSWRRAWAGIGARGDGLDLRDALLSAWAEPQRRYHTLRHLVDSLDLLEPALGTATHPAEVELALWFHDAVYALRGKDNEAQSAAWAARSLHAAGVAPEPAARVVALVLATRHDALPASDDERLLVDVDLAILGADPERFDEYEAEVRQEYAWVPRPLFRRKRREILQGFLARDAIYSTPAFRSRFEAAARANLARSISRLRPWYRRWASP